MISLAKPASLTATRWKFMGRASGSGASMPLRAASYAEIRIAICIAAARTQPMISTPSSRGGRSIVTRIRGSIRTECSGLFGRRHRCRGTACSQWSRAGLAAIFEREVCRCRARCRSFGPRHVGRQLRGAMIVPRVHQGGRYSDQLFGRCERTSLNTPSCGESELQQLRGLNQYRSELARFARLALSSCYHLLNAQRE